MRIGVQAYNSYFIVGLVMPLSRRPARTAELIVQTACVHYGAFYQAVAEDENGWDGMIEFPQDYDNIDGQHVKPHRFFVQIKSTINRSTSCSVKLSNGIRSCKSDDPWFLILVRQHNDVIDIFVRHYWKDMISDTIKTAWTAKQKNLRFNRKRQLIKFSLRDQKMTI